MGETRGSNKHNSKIERGSIQWHVWNIGFRPVDTLERSAAFSGDTFQNSTRLQIASGQVSIPAPPMS